MSYDDAAFQAEIERLFDSLITPEMEEKQRLARKRNHERLVRLGLVAE